MTPARILQLRSIPEQRHSAATDMLAVHCCDRTTPAYQPDRNNPTTSGVIYCTACDRPLIVVTAKDAPP